MTRRRFVETVAALAGTLPILGSCFHEAVLPRAPAGMRLLPRPAEAGPGGVLRAAGGMPGAATGASGAWTLNGALPSPTIRVRRGERFTCRFENGLPEPSILHWHGMLVPPEADGHPRYAVGPGAAYAYAFQVNQRAGTHWYHPHAHHRTAAQIHHGIAGFLIVSDEDEDRLQLPQGEQEILLMLQDRDASPAAAYVYAPTAVDLREGHLRGTAYGNGVPAPGLELPPGRYRLRILNASQARVYRLALSHGLPLVIIGNDGGLLPSAVSVDSAYLGIGERLDCLIDLGAIPDRDDLVLRSLPFSDVPSGLGAHPQGIPMDLLTIRRHGKVPMREGTLPLELSRVESLGTPAMTRIFTFSSAGGEAAHWIAGRHFEMDRIDVHVPLGQVERWEFINDSDIPHPVHVHGCHFQVVERRGGRGQVYPYEGGWKDTVLVMPWETVAVHIRFDAHPGLFLMHCHNLQHEDQGMMLNIEVS